MVGAAGVTSRRNTSLNSQLTGINSEKYYFNLVHTVVVPHTLKKGVLNYIYEFDGWCIELNKICKPANVLSDYA